MRSITGKGRASNREEIKNLRSALGKMETLVVALDRRLADVYTTLKHLVEASNSSSLLLASVERFLDGKFGENWDDGVRKEVEARSALMKRRKELQRSMPTVTEAGPRAELAREIWGLARELDVRADDLPVVVSLHLQNQDAGAALDVVEEVRRDEVALPKEVAALVEKLVARCIEVAESSEDQILLARARSIAKMSEPPIVSP